jgi:multiple sugar transport system permease protein
MTRKRRIKDAVKKLSLHLALLAGSVVFALPFVWLLSSSAKAPDEMFPPRWLPQVPQNVFRSPYVGILPNERPRRPVLTSPEDWDRLYAPIIEAVSARIVEMDRQFPAFYRPYLDHDVLAENVFARLIQRAPDDLFEKVEPLAAGWFANNVRLEIVRDAFDVVYRRVALADVLLYGWDVVTIEKPTASGRYPWKLVEGDATFIERESGLLRPAKEVQYDFSEKRSFAVQADLPLHMAPENLQKIVVSNHGDRSWHEIWATVELNGKKHDSVQAAYLGTDRWQDTTWQFASEADKSLQMKTWLRLEETGASDFNEPDRIRITLEYRYRAQVRAALNKYLNNYRDVLRQVPFLTYVRNSFLLVGLNIFGQILGSSLVAFAFARLRWPGRDFWFILVLATLMVPAQVTMIPVFLIYKNIGWYNTLKPLWIPSLFGSAFYIFILRQFMRTIPTDLEDSARIDGSSYLGIYARIIMPLVKPALATIGVFTFMAVWNDFMGPLIYLSDQRLYPLSLGLFALKTVQGTNIGLMMAASVLMTLPVIALFFVAQRQFIQSITLSGLKA